MSRSTKKIIFWVLILLGFVAILNPGYSAVYVNGPNGIVKTEKYSFGPSSLFVYTRVVADESEVRIEQR